MRIVNLTCPGCGATLNVDADNKTAACGFCGASLFVDDETHKIQLDGAEKMGYDFEKGRQKAQAEAGGIASPAIQSPYAQPSHQTYQQPPYQQPYQQQSYQQQPYPQQPYQPQPEPKKRKTWLWVLGWIFCFPIPLTVLMFNSPRTKDWHIALRIAITVVGWLLFLGLAFSGGGSSSKSNKNENTNNSNEIANVENTNNSNNVNSTAANNNAATTAATDQNQSVTLPDFGGQKLDVAQKGLTDLGLTCEYVSDDGKMVLDFSNWTVIGQEPLPGTVMLKGYPVRFTVSKGTNTAAPADPAAQQTPQEQQQQAVPAPEPQASVPKEYQTALKKAQSYSNNMHMSKRALYEQLTSEYGERYTPEAAQYAIDNVQADWNANALAKAQSYSDTMHMSKRALFDQLTSEHGEQFEAGEAQYAVDNVQANWNENALQKARSYQNTMAMSPSAIYDQLISEHGEQFEPGEAQYAIDNL